MIPLKRSLVVNALGLALATAVATAVGFGIHVLYGQGWAQSYVADGLSFGVLLLWATDAALRFPVMNIATGNPVDVVLVQGAESWGIDLLTGLLIGVITPATFRMVLGSRDAKSQGATT